MVRRAVLRLFCVGFACFCVSRKSSCLLSCFGLLELVFPILLLLFGFLIMNRQLSSRSRKQRLPCEQNMTTFLQPSTDIEADYETKEVFEGAPPKKTVRFINGSRKVSDARDRQAQMDHNEQERGRRRELAIIYEMIRTCITEEDIRRHLDGAGKCPEKLSYPQLLQISCGMIEDEIHDMAIYDRLVKEIAILETECLKLGIPLTDKPHIIPPMRRHEIVAGVVEAVLKEDKASRNRDGDYAISQRERALEAHRKLTELLGDESHPPTCVPSASSFTTVYEPREFRSCGSSRRPTRRSNRKITRKHSLRNLPLPNFVSPLPLLHNSSYPLDQDDFEFPNPHQRRFALVSSTSSPSSYVQLPNVYPVLNGEAYSSPMSREDRAVPSVDQEIVDEFFASTVNAESNLEDADIIGCTGGGDLDDYAFDTLFDVIATEPADDLAKLPFQQ
ncbi:expressed conserved protein [Echinococcus multilocularis]|uniref:Expressed conserved protein n=1 Tax=Echinococcus multilocularis TaxID=6211 RepID=A0A068Y7D3_ECHMU|nr:expressed conserved protein [Echinococcus multilocularis]